MNESLIELVDRVLDDLASTGVAGDSVRGLGDLLAAATPVTDDKALLGAIDLAVRLRNVGDYVLAAATARAEAINLPTRCRVKTGRDILREFSLAPAVIGRIGRLAESLDELPSVNRALRDGGLSAEHADAVVKGVKHVSSRLSADAFDDELRDSVVNGLMAHARVGSPADVAERARHVAHELVPEHAPAVPSAENTDLNEVILARTDKGRVKLDADLDQLSGEKLITALDALSRPIPAPDGGRDPRSSVQRRADGFVHLLDAYLASPDRPISGGVTPHVALTVELPTLVGPAPTSAGEMVPTPAGEGVSTLMHTGSISAEKAREICCGSVDFTAVLTRDSVPVDVKRAMRLAPPGLRAALNARDGGCQFPGCGRPPTWTDAHHILPWSQGGETNLDNTVLLCRDDHTKVHHGGWQVRIGSDRQPWFLPPGKTEWIRSHRQRTMTNYPTAAA